MACSFYTRYEHCENIGTISVVTIYGVMQNIIYIKRCVVVCVLMLLMSVASRAQIGEPRHNICIGFTGGEAMNQIGFDPTIKQKWHVGPTFGIVARFTRLSATSRVWET